MEGGQPKNQKAGLGEVLVGRPQPVAWGYFSLASARLTTVSSVCLGAGGHILPFSTCSLSFLAFGAPGEPTFSLHSQLAYWADFLSWDHPNFLQALKAVGRVP